MRHDVENTLAPMTHVETLQTFAAAFVKPEFQQRFVHEALKKPTKLHERVCHKIDDLFPVKYRNGTVAFKADAPCLVIGWHRGLKEATWGEAHKQMQLGGGLLVIDLSGTKFYAETEGSPKSEVWAGER
jgi:hypothetical protein